MKNNKKSNNIKSKIINSNILIYLIIMGFSIVIRMVPFTIGSQTLDEIINDISIGSFSSALVAWLIYWRISRNERQKNDIYRVETIIPFLKLIANYMQQFCFKTAYMPPSSRDLKHNFLEWSDIYFKKYKENIKGDEYFNPLEIEDIYCIVNKIHNIAKKIQINHIWLQKNNILTKEEINYIKEINTLFRGLDIYISMGKINQLSIETFNKDLNDKLLEINELSGLCSIQFSCSDRLETYIASIEDID